MSCPSCCINNNQAIYPSNTRSDKLNLVHEIPVRDRSNSVRNFAPPKDLPKQDGTWELQYCKWSGWTWVKKLNENVAIPKGKQIVFEHPETERIMNSASHKVLHSNHERPNKKKKCCGCFGKKESTKIQSLKPIFSEPPPVQTSTFLPSTASSSPLPQNVLVDKETQYLFKKTDMKRSCCCCCCCCCCCSGQHFCNTLSENICGNFDNNQECSKCVETQTKIDMKEKATTISTTCINKQKNEAMIIRRCCKQPIYYCCCCNHQCCLCLKNKKVSNDQKHSFCNDLYVNYCLTENKNKPVSSDIPKNKYSNSFLLNKSLDLLIKNNINLSSLITGKHLKNSNKNIYQFLEYNAIQDQKSSPIETENFKHRNVLTTVCDAILSNHKLNDSSNILQKMNASAKNSDHSVLDFNDSNLGKTDAVHHHCEIGIQVGDGTKQSRKFGNLPKSYNRLPHRLNLLRKNLYYMKKKQRKRASIVEPIDSIEDRNSKTYLPTDLNTKLTQKTTTLSTINKLLESIKLLSNTTASATVSQNHLQEDRTTVHLLDATSPPFTDYEYTIK